MAIAVAPISAGQFDVLLTAFNEGYQGYKVPVHLDAAQLRGHLDNNNIDLGASRLAFEDGRAVGMALLGIRGRRAWVGGVGVTPEWRGRGVGRQLMEALIESAHGRGLDRVQLEVIQGNDVAHQLYRKLGFAESRRLLIVERQPVPLQSVGEPPGYYDLRTVAADEALAHAPVLRQVANPWQREPESLRPLAARMTGWLVEQDGRILAYGLGFTGDRGIQWMDIGMEAGAEDAVRALLLGVHARYPAASGRMVNLGEDDPAWPVFRALGYAETMAQHEMFLGLTPA